MSFPKPKRIKDPTLLDSIRKMPCAICRKTPTDPDHIRTRGSGGEDSELNLWPLCREHHIEKGMIGTESFFLKYHLGHKIEWIGSYPQLKKPWQFC